MEKWLASLVGTYTRELDALAEKYAKEIEQWMKDNAAWNDVTGEARQKLVAEVKHIGTDLLVIELRGDAPHMGYLEFNATGRYAILAPAMDYFYPKFLADVKKILGGN